MRRATFRALLALAGAAALARPALAHAGALSGGTSSAIPFWFVVVTGGSVVAASFLFSTLITDHEGIRMVNGWGLSLPAPGSLRAALPRILQGLGTLVLAVVLASALVGPREATENFAVLFVWAGWWAGYTMTVYLVGNTWPAVNPWALPAAGARRVADLLSVERRSLPEAGTWLAVVGLLALVYVEVVTPVAEAPRLLAGVLVVYTVVTLTGAALVGPAEWFGRVDPVARVFRWYGRMAPVHRTEDGVRLRLPTTGLTETETLEGPDETPFVLALLWVTTFDGLVSTPPWAAFVRAVIPDGGGLPGYLLALALYLAALVAGYVLFLAAYRWAARTSRSTAGSYVAPGAIGRWFVPSLLPIAAGYHVAHFLGYFLTLSPALAATLTSPFAAPAGVEVAVLPGWYSTVQLALVVLGHMLAVWVAHGLSFELFPGTFKPIRSQYPFIVVMVFYTMTSMWVISQPYVAPPGV